MTSATSGMHSVSGSPKRWICMHAVFSIIMVSKCWLIDAVTAGRKGLGCETKIVLTLFLQAALEIFQKKLQEAIKNSWSVSLNWYFHNVVCTGN